MGVSINTARSSVCGHIRSGPRHLFSTSARRCLSNFWVHEHIVPAQHTRQWPRGTEIGHENALKLAVKQYVPKDNSTPTLGDITFIAAHANGFPKELYEPLWDDLYTALLKQGRRISSIWIADLVHQGESAVLNERSLGNDPNWWDGARDLLYLINQKQDMMPQPLFGIGHSMGASQLVALSLLHPGLMRGLVLIDPVIQTENPSKTFAPASTYRRDTWPSRQDAVDRFSSSKFYQAWDPRVLAQWNKYGVRELPTELYPDAVIQDDPPVTLKTPVSQEVFSYLRPKYYGSHDLPPENDRLTYGDMHPQDIEREYDFYRPEPAELFRRLPDLKPPVVYIFGKHSELATPKLRQKKLDTTGTGVGGSGGREEGFVQETVLDCGHLVPMERVTESAEAAASFTAVELDRWEASTEEWQSRWRSKSRQERVSIDEEWRARIGPRPSRTKPVEQSTE